MKTVNKILLSGIIAVIGFSSCADYLDVSSYFEETGTISAAFKKRNYVEGFFSNAYEVMYDELADITIGGKGGFSMWATDDLLRMDDNACKLYQNGEYNANNLLKENDKWKRVYETIRKASTFLQYVDSCKELTLNEISEYKAQAHFLRGYAYWTLFREYGPIPLMPEYGLDISLSYEQMAVPRNTLDECVDFMANEFLKAARNLPLSWPANSIGRPTRGAALAARARVYLYAASPLYNRDGNELFNLKDNEGKQLIPQTYDESKWARAAAAALDVINLNQYSLHTVSKTDATTVPPVNVAHPEYSTMNFPNGWADIDPYASYSQLFDGTVSSSKNKEIIFTRPNDNKDGIRQLVSLMMPYSLKGANTVAVTLKQFEAYYRKDGKTVDEARTAGEYEFDNVPENQRRTTVASAAGKYPYIGRMVSLKFINLEPRFYASIAYPGSIWEAESNPNAYRNQQVFYYQGQSDMNGNMYSNPKSFPITGLGMRKFYNKTDGLTEGGTITDKFEPAIRYADVLLWYAEAINEIGEVNSEYTVTTWQNENIVIRRDVNELKRGVKPVRMRAGIPDFSDEIYENRSSFRSRLKRERQIELFGECKRYYDLRRWRDAQVEENIPVRGFNTDMPSTGTSWARFYDGVSFSSAYPKYFIPKMYLWPIPQYELTRNKKLTQNPGW
ncbi:RagB/SusD family nutrient uptake outer membrane protein [Paludibacter sp.]